MTDSSKNKLYLNNNEYDIRDLTNHQQELLSTITLADSDIHKMTLRLAAHKAGRESLVQLLATSVEETTKSKEGETNNG